MTKYLLFGLVWHKQYKIKFKGLKMRFNTLEERTEFEKTTGKDARIKRYKHLCHLSEDFVITEDNLDKDVFHRICVESGCNPHMFKAQLIGKDKEYWGQE